MLISNRCQNKYLQLCYLKNQTLDCWQSGSEFQIQLYLFQLNLFESCIFLKNAEQVL